MSCIVNTSFTPQKLQLLAAQPHLVGHRDMPLSRELSEAGNKPLLHVPGQTVCAIFRKYLEVTAAVKNKNVRISWSPRDDLV